MLRLTLDLIAEPGNDGKGDFGLSVLDAPWKAIAVIILYVVIQQFESLVLVPLWMQREVSLPPYIYDFGGSHIPVVLWFSGIMIFWDYF